MLASCVNLFRRSEDLPVSREQARVQRMMLSDAAKADLECITAHVTRDGHAGSVGEGPLFDAGMLPSRLLAIANLVRDRFAWVYSESNESFYYYLGVRQGSNMTSTGALDSLMSEAFLELLSDDEKYATFIQWVDKLFPKCELILHFSRYSQVYNNVFLTDPKKWLKQRVVSGRKVSESDQKLKRIEANLDDFKSLVPRRL